MSEFVVIGIAGTFLLVGLYVFLSRSHRNRLIVTAVDQTIEILDRLSRELPINFTVDLALRSGEEVVWVDKSVELLESRRAPRISSRSTDAFTVALAKGFYYTAASGTTVSPEPGDEIRLIDRGRATYTTMRVVFVGSHYTREWDLSKIVGWSDDHGGNLMIATTNRKRLSGLGMQNPTKGLSPSLAFQLSGIASENGWEAARRQSKLAIEAAQNQKNILLQNPYISTESLNERVSAVEEARLEKLESDEPEEMSSPKEESDNTRPIAPISEIEIVGQVFQKQSFLHLHDKLGCEESGEFIVEASLRPEPENSYSRSGKAVAVYVRNLRVGYVPEWLAPRVFDAISDTDNEVLLGGRLYLAGKESHPSQHRLTLEVDPRLKINE